ncbi:MAG: hypothetical protein ACYTEZ_19580 [Planctomycetota bacterium]
MVVWIPWDAAVSGLQGVLRFEGRHYLLVPYLEALDEVHGHAGFFGVAAVSLTRAAASHPVLRKRLESHVAPPLVVAFVVVVGNATPVERA